MAKELEQPTIEELKFELEEIEGEEDFGLSEEETVEEKVENLNLYLRFNSNQSPTVAVQSAAGTGATATISGNDTKGTITLTTGSAAYSSGAQAIVTFVRNYGTAPVVVLTAADADAAVAWDAHDVFVTSTTTTFSLTFGTAEAAGVEMLFNYHCLE